MKQLVIFTFAFLNILGAFSQETEWRDFNHSKHSLSFNLGLIQPFMLKGANVEMDYRYKHFIVSYSHGWGLDIGGATAAGANKTQNVSLHLPYSTGFGIGGCYNIMKTNLLIDARFEPKLHQFEASYGTNNNLTMNKIASYKTLTLGAGIYFTYLPFAKMNNLMCGLNLGMNFRYWQNVTSSLPNNQVAYFNEYTGKNEIHKAANIGIANTPWVINMSIGYLFK